MTDRQVRRWGGTPSEKERATKSEENRRLLFGFPKPEAAVWFPEREREAPTGDRGRRQQHSKHPDGQDEEEEKRKQASYIPCSSPHVLWTRPIIHAGLLLFSRLPDTIDNLTCLGTNYW